MNLLETSLVQILFFTYDAFMRMNENKILNGHYKGEEIKYDMWFKNDKLL